MMTSSNGNIFRVTGHLCGEFTGPRWTPCTKASDAELWWFLQVDLRLNKRLSKPSWGWWFETLSRPLWRHCNVSGWLPTIYNGWKHNVSEICAEFDRLCSVANIEYLCETISAWLTYGFMTFSYICESCVILIMVNEPTVAAQMKISIVDSNWDIDA